MQKDSGNVITVTNMTSLFNKEMLMYSLFDISLPRPIRVSAILYFALLFVIIGLPIIVFTWPPSPVKLAIAIGIPFGGASLMSKPIWNGKTFISYFKTQLKYMKRPKVLYDWCDAPKETTYKVNSTITVSRHKDYNKLYNLKLKEMNNYE